MFDFKRKKMIEALSNEEQFSRKKDKKLLSNTMDALAQDLSELKKVQEYLYLIKEDIHSEARQIDWEKNTSEILQNVKAEVGKPQSAPSGFLINFIRVPYKIGFAAISIITLGFIFFFIINRNIPTNDNQIILANSVEHMANALAKNETVEYLQQSSIILSSVSNMSAKRLDNDILKLNAEHAKSLLLKKKYINQNLNNYDLASAQSICNQVEYLLYDISQIENSTDIESIDNIKSLIQDKKIMLKIKLVQSELTDKEV